MRPTSTDAVNGHLEAADELFRIYSSYVDAGFTERQAEELVKVILATTLAGNKSED